MYQTQKMTSSFCKEVRLCLPEREEFSGQIVYVLDGEKLTARLLACFEEAASGKKPVIVSTTARNRLEDYTPWPAKALSERFPDFGGQGAGYVHRLEAELMPAVAERLRLQGLDRPRESILLGFSLGGLLAVYASFLTDAFEGIVSVSGSFWYPQWDAFVQSRIPVSPKTKYLMLYGKNEGAGKASAQKDAALRTLETYQRLCGCTEPFPIYADEGGHHDGVQERLRLAAHWITGQPTAAP